MRIKKLEINPQVRAVLQRCTYQGTMLRLPSEQLSRPLYEAVDKVLRAAGGKWDKKQKAHVFPAGVDPQALFVEALDKGEIVDDKKTRQAFYTPPDLAARVVAEAGIKAGELVLEPSAGAGALVEAIRAAGGIVTAIEQDAKTFQFLLKRFAYDPAVIAVEGDFLTIPAKPPAGVRVTNLAPMFDCVLMNPPFSGGQDVEHVRHALNFLRPGGRLVAIMSGGVKFRTEARYKSFLELVAMHTSEQSISDLPTGAFRESGTMIQAVLFVCTKRGLNE